jgi:hypothetical protein
MMEAASTSEMSVDFYQTRRRYNPEDSHLHMMHIFFQMLYSMWYGFQELKISN